MDVRVLVPPKPYHYVQEAEEGLTTSQKLVENKTLVSIKVEPLFGACHVTTGNGGAVPKPQGLCTPS